MSFQRLFTTLKPAKMTLLIDGDLFLYKSAIIAEEETCWDEEGDIWSLRTDLKIAKEAFQKMITNFCEHFGTTDFIIALSDRKNFRKEIFPEYKSNRKKTRKPVGYAALLDWCKENYSYGLEPLLEADDVMGIIATHPDNEGKTIIISDDKDMRTIPCHLYRPMNGEETVISKKDADLWFLTQCLVGDPTDGFKGCPTIGIKTAEKILGPRPDWSSVEQAYSKQGISKVDAITQSRMARILRFEDWDMKTQTIKLWSPVVR